MQKILTEWRKYLTEYTKAVEPPKAAKKKLGARELNSIKENSRAHVRSLLPDVHPENQKRTAYLLGQYFNPKLPKPKGHDPHPGAADLMNPHTHKLYGEEGPLTNKELLAFAAGLGHEQYLHIKNMPINMLGPADWSRLIGEPMTKGLYSPKTRQIYIQVEFKEFINTDVLTSTELASTLLHELWHAIDHTEIRGGRFLKNVKAIPEPKKAAIRKIIAQDFKPMYNDHGVQEHLPTGFMSLLNRKAFDALLATKTHARGEKFTASKAGLSNWEEYIRSKSERQTRFKNLIDAFAKENHPKTITTTAHDVVDFCVNPKKYYKHHKDIRPMRKAFVFCKDYDNNPPGPALGRCVQKLYAQGGHERHELLICRAKLKKARIKKYLDRAKREEAVKWMNRIAKTMKTKQQKRPRFEPDPESRRLAEDDFST